MYFRKYEDVGLDHCEGANLHVARTDTACDCEKAPALRVSSTEMGFDSSGIFPCDGLEYTTQRRVRLGTYNNSR